MKFDANEIRRMSPGTDEAIDGFVGLPYLEGALDGLLTAGLGLKGMQRLGHCTGQMQLVGGQLLAIVNQYMQAHPEEWGDAMPSIIFSALSDACKKIGAPIN